MRAHEYKQEPTRANCERGRGRCGCRIYEDSALCSGAWSMDAIAVALVLVHAWIPLQYWLPNRVMDTVPKNECTGTCTSTGTVDRYSLNDCMTTIQS